MSSRRARTPAEQLDDALGDVPGQSSEAAPKTADLLDQVVAFVRRFVIMPGEHFYDAVALWILHTHALKAADTTPRLVFKSPEKICGKTRALEVLEVLTPSPLQTMNSTVAAVFRLLKDEQATMLFDEVDAIFSPKAARENEDLRALLNAGYRRGATVARVVGEGRKMRVEKFPVFAATALAAIGDLLADIRSVMVDQDRLSSASLLTALNALDEAPWGGWNAGHGMNPRDLAKRLKPFGVESRTVRLGDGSTPKGYVRDDFADPWTRYLRDSPSISATRATSATEPELNLAAVADVAPVADVYGENRPGWDPQVLNGLPEPGDGYDEEAFAALAHQDEGPWPEEHDG